jgi:type VI secretion system protein ImpA
MIDVEALAKPVSQDDQSGPDLEYDPLYLELDGLAVAVPDSFMGESKVEGRGPDWKKLCKNCLDLWGRTRDLRVAVYITIAGAITEGLPGLAAGLKLTLFLVKDMWESFYPRLDPGDDNDPLERLNIISMLSPPSGSVNDPVMFIPQFREIRLVQSLRYTLRDLLISMNIIEAASGVSYEQKLLRAEFMNVPAAEIDAQYDLAKKVKELLIALCEEMNAKMGGKNVLDMSALNREIDYMLKFYDSCRTSQAKDISAAGETAAKDGDSPEASAAATNNEHLSLLSYEVSSRSQALLMLRKGAEYFQNQEPNSPIPLLVNRALRFSDMNFIELIEDIMPDALPRGRDILGVKPEAK